VFGGSPDSVPLLYDIGSPITHISPNSPPTLLFHGAHDFAIDAEQSRSLYLALRRAGVPTVYVEFPYTDHVFDLFFSPWAPAFQAALYDTERFLALMNAE
jgi:dipeptidyl aminopeptidase/acylaminoacyl peptidase